MPICLLYSLENTTSPVEIDIQDFSDWSHHTLNIDISAYNTSGEPSAEQSDPASSEPETENVTNWEQKYNELLTEYQELEKQFEEYKAAYPASSDILTARIKTDISYLEVQLDGMEKRI